MTDDPNDQLNILAPAIDASRKLDYLHREVQRPGRRRAEPPRARSASAGSACWRRPCGGSTNAGGGGGGGRPSRPTPTRWRASRWRTSSSSTTGRSTTTRRPTRSSRRPQRAPRPKSHETYYSSNDELLAKLHAGGTGYDIIVPSQNAVGELIAGEAG